jgi:hypothetical protein
MSALAGALTFIVLRWQAGGLAGMPKICRFSPWCHGAFTCESFPAKAGARQNACATTRGVRWTPPTRT